MPPIKLLNDNDDYYDEYNVISPHLALNLTVDLATYEVNTNIPMSFSLKMVLFINKNKFYMLLISLMFLFLFGILLFKFIKKRDNPQRLPDFLGDSMESTLGSNSALSADSPPCSTISYTAPSTVSLAPSTVFSAPSTVSSAKTSSSVSSTSGTAQSNNRSAPSSSRSAPFEVLNPSSKNVIELRTSSRLKKKNNTAH